MPDEFDWFKAMVGVDILQVEAVGEVVGRTIGALMKGMTDAGLSEEQAERIVNSGVEAMMGVLMLDKNKGEST